MDMIFYMGVNSPEHGGQHSRNMQKKYIFHILRNPIQEDGAIPEILFLQRLGF